MLDARTVYGVRVKFRLARAPTRESFGAAVKAELFLENVEISLYCEPNSFEAGTQRERTFYLIPSHSC